MRRNNYTWERKILLNGLLFFKHYIFKQACSFKVNFLPCINRFITLFCISWLFVYRYQLFSIIFRHRSPGKNNMHFSADNSIRVFSLNILSVDSIPTVFCLLARFFIAHKKNPVLFGNRYRIGYPWLFFGSWALRHLGSKLNKPVHHAI